MQSLHLALQLDALVEYRFRVQVMPTEKPDAVSVNSPDLSRIYGKSLSSPIS